MNNILGVMFTQPFNKYVHSFETRRDGGSPLIAVRAERGPSPFHLLLPRTMASLPPSKGEERGRESVRPTIVCVILEADKKTLLR